MTASIAASLLGATAVGDPNMVPIWWGLDNIPEGLGPCVLAVGVFDGVHRGHAHLVEHAVGIGRANDLPTVLVTFDPHPARVLGIPRDTSTLTTIPERATLVADLGIDAVAVLRFTRELASRSPAEFVAEVLAGRLRAQAVVVGANFTFGARAAGTVDTLTKLGEQYGFSTHAVGLLQTTDIPCSSTATRACLQRGDVVAAAEALGRPHRVTGRLEHGLITMPAHTALPRPGTYRTLVVAGKAPEAPVADWRIGGNEIDLDVIGPRQVKLRQPVSPLTTLSPMQLSVAFLS